MKSLLLSFGWLSSLWYLIINIYVPMQYEGYNMASFTPSELSAIGSPTRNLWIALVLLYPFLFAAFGYGILKSFPVNRRLKTLGWIIIAYCIFNFYWPPMHMRGVQPTLTDTLHIVWAAVTVLLMIVMMVIGATTFGGSFRIYTIVSISLHVLFGILTSLQAPNIPTNGPTPTIGIWERINIAVFMLWIAVLSLKLIRQLKEYKLRTA